MRNELIRCGGGSFDHIFGIEIYGGRSKKWWHRAFVMPVYRLGRQVHKVKWAFFYRVHPEHRYNLIETGLEPGYYDIDIIMLHGMFRLLRRYVEDEMGGVDSMREAIEELKREPEDTPGRETISGQIARYEEALSLYNWWTVGRPATKKWLKETQERLFADFELRFEDVPGTELSRLILPKRTEEEEASHEEVRRVELQLEEQEQQNLHRLVDLRQYLWT